MKTQLVFLVLDALMLLGYGLILFANLARRFFRHRTKVQSFSFSKPRFDPDGIK